MSERRGTPRSVVLPSAIRHAAMIGSELFLLPLISTLPLRRLPPRRMKLSIWPLPGPEADTKVRLPCPKCAAGNTGVRHLSALSATPLADDQLIFLIS